MRVWLLLAALFAALATPLRAEPAVPGATLRVSVLTFAPGETYWQRFGHNALLVEDTATGADAVYNYGMFDFFQKNFFLNFARGEMQYRLDVDTLDRTLALYASEGRWVYRQVLALDAPQRLRLAAFLHRNAQPDQREYRYDYFRDNCSTRVRDAVDHVLDGALQAQLAAQATAVSYRHEATRLMAPIPPLMAGMDFIVGSAADAPITRWQQSFVPEVFMQALSRVRLEGRPLVAAEGYLLADAGSPVAPTAPLDLLPLMLPAGLLLGLALWLLARWPGVAARRGLAALALLFWLATALAGLAMAAAWGLTAHWVMWANHNLLLASPLAALLLPWAWRNLKRPQAATRGQQQLALALALASLLALALLLLPGAQQHGAWVALLLPAQCVLAWALRRA